jgi:hypothetical protein
VTLFASDRPAADEGRRGHAQGAERAPFRVAIEI